MVDNPRNDSSKVEGRYRTKDTIVFSSVNPIRYGSRVTILGDPVAQGKKWVTKALVSATQVSDITVGSIHVRASSFVILRSWATGKGEFAHKAVSTEWLEETSEHIENDTVRLLDALWTDCAEGLR
jgi:hypothetical protein